MCVRVFGTVVDWRTSVIADSARRGKAKGLNISWVEFTDRWRMGYGPAMNKVRKGEIPWTNLDDLQRMILDLLKQYRIEGLSEEEKIDWAHVWRRLKPWPDSVEGLTRYAPMRGAGDSNTDGTTAAERSDHLKSRYRPAFGRCSRAPTRTPHTPPTTFQQ
jgi:hypothetical protein